MAARIHDSVLQTLALVQRDAEDAPRGRALARRQERELRRWLYGRGYDGATTLADALAEAVAEVEEAHLTRIELAPPGCPLDDPLGELVARGARGDGERRQARESDEISVYAEVDDARSPSSSATAASGFDPARSPRIDAGSPSRSTARLRAAGGPRRSPRHRGNGTEVESDDAERSANRDPRLARRRPRAVPGRRSQRARRARRHRRRSRHGRRGAGRSSASSTPTSSCSTSISLTAGARPSIAAVAPTRPDVKFLALRSPTLPKT